MTLLLYLVIMVGQLIGEAMRERTATLDNQYWDACVHSK